MVKEENHIRNKIEKFLETIDGVKNVEFDNLQNRITFDLGNREMTVSIDSSEMSSDVIANKNK